MVLLPLHILGILAFLGATIYAVGDVLLLAGKISLDDYPKLKPFAKLLSTSERMAALSPERMMWGALLGVFATPLILLGYWQAYQGLGGANAWAVLATVGLFGCASVIGAFVHGTFYTYAPLLLFIIAASILFSILVASGNTNFPVWVAWITPLTMTVAWLLIKRILPQFIRDWTEGAGFSIAHMIFFASVTLSLWK